MHSKLNDLLIKEREHAVMKGSVANSLESSTFSQLCAFGHETKVD